MVDPFQVLDNGNTLSGTNENQQILLRLKQNMNEDTTNLRICNEPAENATNDEEKKTIDFDVPGTNDDDDGVDDERKSGTVNDNLDRLKMGVPLNHQSYELNHMPYQSNNKKNEQNFQESFDNDIALDKQQSEYCVSDNCESESGMDADADFLITHPINESNEHEQLTKHCELSVSSSSSGSSTSSSSSSSLNLSDADPSNQSTVKCNSINVHSSNLLINCVNTNLSEFVPDMETINNYDSPTSTTTDAQEMDNRRVEPLKINLHREPIKTIIKIPKHATEATEATVPKITIKSIKLPPQCGEEDKHTLIVDSSVSTSSTSQNCSSDPPSEPHVIPKLTIRNSTNFGIAGQSEIVPKLTIKMDNHIASTASINNKDKTITSDDGIKLTIKPILEPPIPKLTIKTNSNDCAEVVNNTMVSKFSINAGPSSPSSSTAAMNKLNRSSQQQQPSKSESIVPKIKIKQITKTDPLGEVPQFTIEKSDDAVNSFTNKCETKDNAVVVKTVPKLVVKLPKESESDQSKTKNYENDDTNSLEHVKVDVEHEIVPKITIRQIKQLEQTASENIIIPKVTIKPIINPNSSEADDSETLVTPKITIKPIPKPLDISQPLEIVTSPPSAIKLTEASNESQQSPRIILKINKTTSETISKNVVDIEDNVTNQQQQQQQKDVPSNNALSKKQQQFPLTPSGAENDLKRANSTIIQTPVENKRLKLDPSMHPMNATSSDEIINLDSDDDAVTEPMSTVTATTTHSESNNRHDEEKAKISQIPPTIQPPTHHDHHDVTTQKTEASTAKPTITPPITVAITTQSLTSTSTTSMTTPSIPKHNSNSTTETIKPKLPFPGNFFLGEDVRPEIPHPLLTHTIERARLLVSMMNADAEEQAKNKRSQLLILSEGSSSDCIMLGDNGTSLPNSIDFGVGNLNENGQNNADRDSGVDVSNSVKSGADDIIEDITPIKRGRGRPRKDVTTPAVIR